MNNYEAMFIFPEALKEDELEQVTKRAQDEITKLGGTIEEVKQLGKKSFVRAMNKQGSGYYVTMNIQLDGAQVKPLLARYKLAGEVFRIQVVRAEPVAAGSKVKEKNDGVNE